MLVTTPEKWDVVTRKSTGDVALTQIVKLLIIDEVHLLHDDRGSVIECLVARTLRQVKNCVVCFIVLGVQFEDTIKAHCAQFRSQLTRNAHSLRSLLTGNAHGLSSRKERPVRTVKGLVRYVQSALMVLENREPRLLIC